MKLLRRLIKTPFHPQWFSMLRENEQLRPRDGVVMYVFRTVWAKS